MPKKMECQECGDKKPGPFHADPRDPPMDEGPCLCLSCAVWITEDCAEEHRETATQLDADVKKLKALEKKRKLPPPKKMTEKEKRKQAKKNAEAINPKTKCQRCGKRKAEDKHTCPYACEIRGDKKFKCNCCEPCRVECAGSV